MSSRLILLAEDDDDLASLLMDVLEEDGYTVVHARHGAHALSLLETVTPSIIVTDLMMPEMDGLAFLRELGARPGPRPPVLAMSAFQGYLEAAGELGAAAVLAKPFSVDDLLGEVDALANGGRSKRERARPLPLDERQRLRAVVELRLDEPSPSRALDQFTQRVARIFDVPICLTSIVTRDRQFWHAHCGLPDDLAAQRGTPRQDSFCTHAVAANSALVVIDTRENPFFASNVLVRERGLRFYAGVPLSYRRGEPLGTLCLLDFAPRPFTVFDLELLSILARRVVSELEWRERRLRPGVPLSSFRHLSWLDEELDILGREAFEQALQVESIRAAERRLPVSLVVVSCASERLESVSAELKAEFPRSLLGRLGLARLAVLAPDTVAAETEARARRAAGTGAEVACEQVPRMIGGAESFLGALEARVRPASARD